MDRLPPPSDTELVRLLEAEREAATSPGADRGASDGARPGPIDEHRATRVRRHVEAALPLEDFLREIEEPTA